MGSFENKVKALGLTIADDQSRAKLIRKGRGCLRCVSVLLAGGYGLTLLVLWLGFRYVGEQNLGLAFLLYVPRILFLLPCLAIVPIAGLLYWRPALFLVVISLGFFFFGMGWKVRPEPQPDASIPGKTLTVLTYNRGEHQNQSLQPFKNATDPDIIVLQEAPHRASGYARAAGYEKFLHTMDRGEYTILSRYPILEGVLIDGAVARFVIDFQGTTISVYAVHVISPRDTLLWYRRGAFLQGFVGFPGTPWGEKRKRNETFWSDRIEQAKDLANLIAEDPRPFLIAGDLNAPAGGYIHGIFLSRFRDAHLEAGHGFGYTFPGITRNPLTGYGPWMRIDYLFSDQRWEPVWCITEKERPSQHRALTAQFRLVNQAVWTNP